jgi:hypothetical protein
LALLGDAVPAIGVGLERQVGRLSQLEGSPLRQPTPRHSIGRPVQHLWTPPSGQGKTSGAQ